MKSTIDVNTSNDYKLSLLNAIRLDPAKPPPNFKNAKYPTRL